MPIRLEALNLARLNLLVVSPMTGVGSIFTIKIAFSLKLVAESLAA
jgi:hypothetical protein